ncbi:MAG: hypothetical protein P8Y63_06705 [Deltaproteobacteria bacterium]|jgi:hypothetical protein
MKHFAVLSAFLFSVLTTLSPAAAASLELGDHGLPDLAGNRRFESGLTYPLLPKYLGMNGLSSLVSRLPANFGRHHLSFSYLTESRSILDRSIVSFFLNDKTEAGFDYMLYNFVYQYDFLDLENVLAGFSAGMVGQIKLMENQRPMLGGADQRTTSDLSSPLPFLGMILHMDILGELLAARVRATGMGYSPGDVFDGQAELSLTLSPFLDIYGGYRFLFIDLETDDARHNFDHSGPYVGITLSF